MLRSPKYLVRIGVWTPEKPFSSGRGVKVGPSIPILTKAFGRLRTLGGWAPSLFRWLITMVSIRPLRIGLWDPFQMAIGDEKCPLYPKTLTRQAVNPHRPSGQPADLMLPIDTLLVLVHPLNHGH